ncbi:RNA-binding protein 43 [Megalobrama amblycephala]|uniref:RNA-binding protein 43 n=1 Tax=Megalobrama amblycephala TaxID=75352 RepID=UPI002014763D|nr:RNA-binding protein 43 [Megalobrama amblycephala]
MAMKEMVIEVNGLPDNYPENMMIDKLTMHFLRRSNKGGDVLTVIYPTSNKGQAYVVFESPEVPGVLQHTHVLIVESQFYPLDIKKVHQPQLDMPAEAFIDMNMFSNHRKIQELLHSHGFHVSETSPGQLHLQGSFLKLKLIYPKLVQFLVQETHPQRGTPSHYTNGYSSVSRAEKSDSSDYESRSNFTSRRRHNNGNSVYAEGRSTSSGITSRSTESQYRQASLQNASLLDRSSSTESPFSSPSRIYEDSRTSVQQRNPSSPRQTEESIPVDPDVWKYIMHFKKDFINKIKSDHHTHINHEVELGVVMVKISGGNFGEAAKELSELIQEITDSVRTQEIDMNACDESQKRDIIQKAYSFQHIYSVLIRREGNIIKVLGSSKDSYEAKQKLLGRDVDIAPPKRMERNSSRRSSSLPRQKTRARMENLDIDQIAATVSCSSASHSQTDSQSQQEVQKERGRQPSKSTADRRSQSGSRLQHRNQKSVKQEPSTYVQQDLTPSSGVQTSKQGPLPKLKGSLFTDKSKKFLKRLKP